MAQHNKDVSSSHIDICLMQLLSKSQKFAHTYMHIYTYKITLKFTWKGKRPRMPRTIWKIIFRWTKLVY